MSLTPKILIIDNDNAFHSDMRIAFSGEYTIDAARDLMIVDTLMNKKKYDLVLCDLAMDRGDVDTQSGIDRIPKFKEKYSNTPLIVVTKHRGTDLVIQALKKGADDFLFKHEYDVLAWRKKFEKNLKLGKVEKENNQLKSQLINITKKEFGFVGNDPKILEAKEILRGIGAEQTPIRVLITGETGVGKEVAARYLHHNGLRRDQPFQVVHLSSITDTLLESTLFGHKKGSFTDAKTDQVGYFQQADGGILFLDEIGDINQTIQLKLLRFIENKSIRVIGTDKDVQLDVQIVAATNKDLKQEVKNGHFREDLYHRIKMIQVELPPLRERKDDISKIMTHYLGATEKELSELIERTALDKILTYHFPGNIRELRNAIEYIQLWKRIKKKDKIDCECLPVEIKEYNPTGSIEIEENESNFSFEKKQAFEELMRIENTLTAFFGNKRETAVKLNYTNTDNLRYRIKSIYSEYPDLFINLVQIKKKYSKTLI